MMDRTEIINLIRNQIRAVVDPMFIKMRTELYGSTFNNHLQGNLIPPDIIYTAVEQGVQELAESEGLVASYRLFNAGGSGVQEGKVVYFDGSVVQHASATDITHNGRIVGIAAGAAGPGSPVRVQQYGVLTSSQLELGTTVAPVLCGVNGALTKTIAPSSQFVQFVGTSIGPNELFVFVTPEAILI